jgi:probable HAF family extracellular repeat protein
MKPRILPLVVACASIFATGTPIAHAQTYAVTDLGLLSPAAISIEGQVVGNYENQAYIWTRTEGMRPLGTLPGGTTSTAAAINDVGEVAGTADGLGTVISPYEGLPNLNCTDLTQPFIWTQKNGMQGLGTVGFYNGNYDIWCEIPFYASGINNLGEVVGYSGSSATYEAGFSWTQAAAYTVLADAYPPTFVNGVTQAGEAAGQSGDSANLGTAAYWINGSPTYLGTLGGAGAVDYASSANGANDLGQVVGWSTTTGDALRGGSPVHAVLWTSTGVISDLGTLAADQSSAASAISFFGLVIGTSGSGLYQGQYEPPPFEVTGHPFIWSKRSGMLELNTLLPSNSGWVLTSVAGINFWGQIVGSGTLNGQPRGFLLTPKNF